MPVHGLGGQALQSFPLPFQRSILSPFGPILPEQLSIRIDDDQSRAAIDHQRRARSDVDHEIVHAHHARDAQRAREDRGVVGAASAFHRQAGDVLPLELTRIGRSHDVGYEDVVTLQFSLRSLVPTRQVAQQPPRNVEDVPFTLAEVVVLEAVEDRRQLTERRFEGPLCVDALLA